MERETIIIGLTSREPAARREALEQLSGDQVAEDIVLAHHAVRLFSDADRGVKDAAGRLLESTIATGSLEVASRVAALITSEDIEVRNQAGDILAKAGDIGLASLIPYLSHDNRHHRKFSCDVIGLIGLQEAVPYVLPLLDDTDHNVACSAIESLGRIRSDESLPFIMNKYADWEDLRPYIIDSLAEIGSTNAQDFLLSIAEGDDEFLSLAAIDALGVCSASEAVAVKLLADIHSVAEPVKRILLRTATAIKIRAGASPAISDEYRSLAFDALSDDDADTRMIALLAVGAPKTNEEIETIVDGLILEKSDPSLWMSTLYSDLDDALVAPACEVFVRKSIDTIGESAALDLIAYAVQLDIPPHKKESMIRHFVESADACGALMLAEDIRRLS